MCLAAAEEIQELLAERDELLDEINRWRVASGAPITPREARPVGENLWKLLDVRNETFGTFPNGFGENPSGDDQELEEPPDSTAHDQRTNSYNSETYSSHMSDLSVIPECSSLREGSKPFKPFDLSSSQAATSANVAQKTGLQDYSHGIVSTEDDFLTMPAIAPDTIVESISVAQEPSNLEWQQNIKSQLGVDIQMGSHIPSTVFSNFIYEPLDPFLDSYPQGSTPHLQHRTFT